MEGSRRVGVYATKFDARGTGNAWSKAIFGDKYNEAVCWGTVVASKGATIKVKWDIDCMITQIDKDILDFKDDGKYIYLHFSNILILK